MKGIKMKDCKFYVNEDKRTVVCVIPYTGSMLIDFIWEHFDWGDISMCDSISSIRKDLIMPRSFVGRAKCAAEDEWDEELGRKIAFSRAKDKCYKSFFKRANRFIQVVDARLGDMITMFNDFGLKLESKQKELQKQIDSKVQAEKE